MKELLIFPKLWADSIKLFLKEIFYSLNIMISGGFNSLNSLSIFQWEFRYDLVQSLLLFKYELYVFFWGGSDLFLEQSFEPFEFNEDSILHESVFTEVLPQIVWLPRVPPIDRAYRSQRSDLRDLLWEHTHLHLSHHHHLTFWFHPFVYIRVVEVLWGVACE